MAAQHSGASSHVLTYLDGLRELGVLERQQVVHGAVVPVFCRCFVVDFIGSGVSHHSVACACARDGRAALPRPEHTQTHIPTCPLDKQTHAPPHALLLHHAGDVLEALRDVLGDGEAERRLGLVDLAGQLSLARLQLVQPLLLALGFGVLVCCLFEGVVR